MINYFPKGCPICGFTVDYSKENYFYKCASCGAFTSAHREDTEYSKEHEPKGYLVDQETYSLKKQLEPLFNFFWKERLLFQGENGDKFTAPINIVFQPYLRKITLSDEPKYGIAHGVNEEGLVKVWILDDNEFRFYKHSELGTVHNRDKTHVFLAQHLNIPIRECRLGYLDKSQLLMAIKICIEHGEYAKEQISYNT